jgi:hypothetical protein
MGKADDSQRQTLIHLLRSEKTPAEAAKELGRSVSWGYKWQERYRQAGWEGLKEQSRTPHRIVRKTCEQVRQAILRTRSELEAEALLADRLSYIGADAILGRLRSQAMISPPGVSTIERILRQAGVTKPRQPKLEKEVEYPTLHFSAAHKLTQVDIVPHYLKGGTSIACFNAIDIASRYPAGKQYENKRSGEATDFLVHVWYELGISEYLQMDNESCFSGGYKHPGVVGQAVRLALYVGTQPVFSPFYHPESNGFVERFHQDYSAFVWKKALLGNLADVRQRSELFFPNYRSSHHHSALAGKSPQQVQSQSSVRKLPAGFSIPKKLPITEGQVHFMRAVSKECQVLILNKRWDVKLAQQDQGVWATLFLTLKGAKLRIYDAAPEASNRRCLVEHPFPLKEPVVPLQNTFRPMATQQKSWWQIFWNLFQRPVSAPSTMS